MRRRKNKWLTPLLALVGGAVASKHILPLVYKIPMIGDSIKEFVEGKK